MVAEGCRADFRAYACMQWNGAAPAASCVMQPKLHCIEPSWISSVSRARCTGCSPMLFADMPSVFECHVFDNGEENEGFR